MLNAIKLFVSFLLLTVGGLSSYGISQIHVRLFLHFLGGSGATLTEDFFTSKELKEIKEICNTLYFIPKVGDKWYVATTYRLENKDSPYIYALGNYSCSMNGAKVYDKYDFKYVNKTKATYSLLEQGRCFIRPDIDGQGFGVRPDSIGRCLVNKGLGKPFEIDITF